ncbi:hypothetical protein UFOVP671_8 [uncultured Caudovirales phage]|uniref:Uncharacterized protein n=1 Tax=uncultured Caudovirales phage TaxID=2100421 RepID=A0A6J5N764_9CAUD|nr:hypothetical protein UFOVP671_8 [uncultured Caudovirales phage]
MENLDQGATSEVENTEIESQEIKQEQESNAPEKSMEDTLRDTLREIQSRETNPEVKDAEVEPPKESSRDEKGRFKSKAEKEQAVLERLPEEAAPEESQDEPNIAVPQAIEPPNTWKKEAKEAFLKADPIIQAEVARRESDFHKGISQYKAAADFGLAIDKAIEPYKQTMQQLGVSPDRAVASLMAADSKLRYSNDTDKHMYFAQLAKSYNIDLNKLVDTAHNTDPRIYQLAEQNQNAQQQLDMYRRQMEAQETQQLNSQVASFAADPNHKYFEQVREQMASLLQAGAAQDLKDAYEQAIYLNPNVRSELLKQQLEAAKGDARRKAQEAKSAASVQVRSRQPLASEEQVGTIEDTIRDTYRRLSGLS